MSCDKGEEYLGRLPEETPVSKNIFQLGFYYDGKYIRFRNSIWRACIPYQYPVVFICACAFFLFLFLVDIFILKKFRFIFSFVLLMPLPLLTIFNIMRFALFPTFRMDCENRVFENGRFFVEKLSFDEIKTIFFDDPKGHGAIMFSWTAAPRFGPQIYLDGGEGHKVFRFVKFHIWECDILTPICIDAIKSFIGKDVGVKQKIPSKLSLFRDKLTRFLALEAMALLISFFLYVVIAIATFHIANEHYNKMHYQPPDYKLPFGEEDLGKGLYMVGAICASFLFSIPHTVLSHIYIFKTFFMRRKKDE